MSLNIFKQVARSAGPLLLGLAMITVAALMLPAPPMLAQGSGFAGAQAPTKTAYVVVQYGPHDVDVRVITYTGVISEWTALEQAGLNPVGFVHSSFGLMLCGINGVGQLNDVQDSCDNGANWWATKDIVAGAWQDNLGVSTTFSDNGHVSGFVWGNTWPSSNPPAESRIKAAALALNWLRKQQDIDGGYGGVSPATEILAAVAANGCAPAEWQAEGGQSLRAYLQANGDSYTSKAGNTGKLMVSLAAAGEDVTTFLGGSLVTTMTGYYSPTTGAYNSGTAYDQGIGPHAWAVLGMRAAGETVPVTATHYLTSHMQAAGCWEWSLNWGCDTNATALAIQAMLATGVSTNATEVISGVTWLKSLQQNDGGFPYSAGSGSDGNSTAYVSQALLAAGESLENLPHGNPIDYLLNLQQMDGQIYWTPDNSGWGTVTTRQVIPALLDTPFPIRRTAGLTACPLTEILSVNYLPLVIKN